ncbi:hypothetical protein LTR84_002302 [Exophiala bonariae]|uniref:Myb-like domain-containing protein n=1 Tax=Exophiala bonariae TaxID=1690606 RepID=A0AAV9NBX6_9EURO|nr:hypothetical protein LTR84_002302 [Exophiala bonariae]
MDDETDRDEPHDLGNEAHDGHIARSDSDENDQPCLTRSEFKSPSLQPFYERKWNRYSQDYNDRYLEIFKQVWENSTGDDGTPEFQPTQLGVISWRPSEKTRLYKALDSKGCRNVKAIAELVGTKSEPEVSAYLSLLNQKETDRQLFEPRTHNISHVEIPAAIEIGSDCEQVLDKAAAALSAFQDNFDFTAGHRNNKSWLIDHRVASELDEKADKADLSDDLTEDSSDEQPPLADSTRFFHVSSFLNLSETFFMNQGSGETWHDLAENDERPSITMDTLTDLHELIVSYLQRLIQSVIFLAKSRIRSTSTISHKPPHHVRQEDVSAAVDVLNLKNDLWAYWVRMARRNKLLVVHKKSAPVHFNPKAVMSYDKLEAILSERNRGRSLSVMSEMSEMSEQTGQSESSDEEMVSLAIKKHAKVSKLADESANSKGDDEEDEDNPFGSENESNDSDSESSPPTLITTSKRKRAEALEAATDEYMEEIDQVVREQEEFRLLQVLGIEPENAMQEEKSEPLRKRPHVMRKTVVEMQGWSAPYQSEWETHGNMSFDTR